VADPAPVAAGDADYVRARYEGRISSGGLNFASMNSGTEERQAIRHAVHAAVIAPNSSVLDVGCGMGYFYKFILEHGFKGRYVGIDLVPQYVDHCAERFPEASFKVWDVLDRGFEEEFDVIVASQVFNAKYPQSDNFAVLSWFMRSAYGAARHAVSIDFLTSYVDFTKPELYYFSPEAVFSQAKALTRFTRLCHDYLPFEFTVQFFVEPPPDH
jgi:SAM-dependent methyltransferase